MAANHPDLSTTHIDVPLTDISIAYQQADTDYISRQIIPEIATDKKSNKFYTFPKGTHFRDEARPRAPGVEAEGGGYEVEEDRFECNVWAYRTDISDQELQNTDTPIDRLKTSTNFVTQRMLMRQEIDFRDTFFKSGIWDYNTTGGTDFEKWSNYTDSNPIEDMAFARSEIQKKTAKIPNIAVMGYDVFRILQHHPDVVDRMKYTSQKIAEVDTMSTLFGLDKILVGKAILNTGKDGLSDNFERIYGDNVCLYYFPDAPAIETPTAGYRFRWTGVSDSGEPNTSIGITRIDMPQLRSIRIESQEAWVNKVVGTDLGYFMSDVVDSQVT